MFGILNANAPFRKMQILKLIQQNTSEAESLEVRRDNDKYKSIRILLAFCKLRNLMACVGCKSRRHWPTQLADCSTTILRNLQIASVMICAFCTLRDRWLERFANHATNGLCDLRITQLLTPAICEASS